MLSLVTSVSKKINVKNPKQESELLLCHVLKKTRENLLFDEIKLSKTTKASLDKLIERRNLGEPLEYILNKTQFFGFDFFITKDVLIPRPETEVLVSKAIELLSEKGRVLDIGTGSGCIGISIALAKNNVKVHAIEKSKKAVDVIKKNSLNHALDNFSYEKIDVLDFKGKNYDLVVANPPYVSYLDSLDCGVKNYEPWEALFSGMTGLECIEKWSRLSYDFLKPGGLILFEIGFKEACKAKEIFKQNGFKNIELIKDLLNVDRIIMAKKF